MKINHSIRGRVCCIAALILLITGIIHGQIFLQLEKMNSPRTRKFAPGYEITFQLKGGQWYTRIIDNVSYEHNHIVFGYGHVNLDSIVTIRSFSRSQWSKPIGNQFYNFAIAWTGYALIAAAVDKDDSYTRGDFILAASSAATGFAIKKLFKRRTFSLEKNKTDQPRKWRLRIIDLNIDPKSAVSQGFYPE
jgi:hypothetical protein